MRKVLNDANYDKLSDSDIKSALAGINVDIDLDRYDFLEVYVR